MSEGHLVLTFALCRRMYRGGPAAALAIRGQSVRIGSGISEYQAHPSGGPWQQASHVPLGQEPMRRYRQLPVLIRRRKALVTCGARYRTRLLGREFAFRAVIARAFAPPRERRSELHRHVDNGHTAWYEVGTYIPQRRFHERAAIQ